MPVFKFVISDPETRRTYQIEVDQNKTSGLIGKKIGEDFNGDLIDLPGYTLRITGGTDKDGFPMHPQFHGMGRKKLLLSSPPGFHPRTKGQRKRKMVRGNTISQDIVQINTKIIKKGSKPIDELLSMKGEKKEGTSETEKKAEKKIKLDEPEKEKKDEVNSKMEEKSA